MKAIQVLGAISAFGAMMAFSGTAAAQVNVVRVAQPQNIVSVGTTVVRPPVIAPGIRRPIITPPSRGRGR